MRYIRLVNIIAIAVFFCVFSEPVKAKLSLEMDLASDHVDITTGFNGAPLYVYGTINSLVAGRKAIEDENMTLAIVVKGPGKTVIVRRKEQIMGMWMNRTALEFQNVYSFYDLATNRPVSEFENKQVLNIEDIGLNYLDFHAGRDDQNIEQTLISTFREALIQNKQNAGLYALREKAIDFPAPGFFKAKFNVPPNVPTGKYQIKGYLFEDGELADTKTLNLKVAQIGMNAEIYKFAYQQTLLYGFAAVLFALVLGWSAHAFLRHD